MRIPAVLAALALTVAALLDATGSAQAAAQKYALIGPFADVFCSTLEPADEDYTPDRAPGFAIFNANAGKVSAVVSVKDARPNTRLPVRLVQGGVGGGTDCFDVDGVITTNSQGNGTINVAERPAGTRAQVIIDTSALFGSPTYRATQIFVFGE
jgi:hypothetical protein